MDNYFSNMQTIATARADNPRTPDDEPCCKITFYKEANLREYIKEKKIPQDEAEDMIEEFFDQGFYEVEE